jgi:hypothetical protein
LEGAPNGSWYKLTPDINGNYVNGTWSQIASLPVINGTQYSPDRFASAVLPDGRVIIVGGLTNDDGNTNGFFVSMGAIYDPVANTWAPVSPPSGPGWLNTDTTGSCNGGIGDGASVVLPNGQFMVGAACASPAVDARFNAANLSWASTGAPTDLSMFPFNNSLGKTFQYQQYYTLLPSNKVMTIDIWDPPHAQQYDFTTGVWTSIANTPVPLVDTFNCSSPYFTIGPAVARPDGTVVAFGGYAGGYPFGSCPTIDPTAIYNVSNNTWTLGPNVPAVCGTDGTTGCSLAATTAALLPNGNIFFLATAGLGGNGPINYFEFTTTNIINQVADTVYPKQSGGLNSFNLLNLPTGQVLLTTTAGGYVEIYTPATNNTNPILAPTVSSAPSSVSIGSTYDIGGTQFNGVGTAASSFVQGATNYPLVQIVNNNTGHVLYARTSGFSTAGITLGAAGSATFQVPSNIETGGSCLYLVAYGISSSCFPVCVVPGGHGGYCPAVHDFNGDRKSDIVWQDTSGNTAVWLMNGAAVTSASGFQVPGWSIVGQRDFNADGNADLLWRDTSGNTALWLMNGVAVTSALSIGKVSGWNIVAVGSFAGVGTGGLVWQDANSNFAMWLMNTNSPNTVASVVVLGNIPGWSIAGSGDFNGDGFTDLLWRDAAGDMAIWFMNGITVLSAGSIGNVAGWSVVGTGDFNGDGKADIAWSDESGHFAIWLMNNTTVTQAAGFSVPGWTIVQIGDYNGDGRSDLLWRDTAGDMGIWFMNGTAVGSAGYVATVPSPWAVQSVNAE